MDLPPFAKIADEETNKLKCILCNETIDSLKLWGNHINSEKHSTNLINFEKKAEFKKARQTQKKSSTINKNNINNINIGNKPGGASAPKKQMNSAANLFSAYADVEESESEEESDLDEDKKQLLKENVMKIINTTFEDKESNKKNLLSNIPKGFFDNPNKDYRYQLELEEEKEIESKKAQTEKEKKKKIEEEKRRKENLIRESRENAEEKESEGESEDAALNEEISAMIECAEFLGNLTKKEKKRKMQKFSFGEEYGDEKQEIKDEDKNQIGTGKGDKKELIGRKRNAERKDDKKDNSEDESVDLDAIINTDFRNIN